jgi:hypothetical protein
MKLEINVEITESHFQGTFIFPDDIDFIGEITSVQFFADSFNEMIDKRLFNKNCNELSKEYFKNESEVSQEKP